MEFDATAAVSPTGRRWERLIFVAALLLLCLWASATISVMASGRLPILNQGFALQHAINIALIAAVGLLGGMLLAGVVVPRWMWLGRCVALLLLFLVALEIELRLFDRLAISVDHSLVPIASRPVRAGGAEIFLPQSTPISPLGFRWAHGEPIKKTGYRVLMLGNSFVYGSGKTFATNYPQALEAMLRQRHPQRNITIMPAGVNGYGLVEELQLYRYLINKGYDFDAVVLSYTTGTDPSQNQPATRLTVIAGQKQRLHDSWFLRTFYPLDYYVARYLIYLRGMSQEQTVPNRPVAASNGRDGDGCPPNPGFDASTLERVNYYYRPGAAANVPLDVSIAALQTLGQEVTRHGQQFLVVLLPDRNTAVATSRLRFAGQTMDWDWIRSRIVDRLGGRYPLLDMADAYRDRGDLFACGDVHWNAQGNMYGAHLVDHFLNNHIN